MRIALIDWTDLETAFERNSPTSESFLDTRSGEVVTVTEGALDHAEQRQKVQAGGEAFVRIEPAPSREQYKWMERFVAGVADEALRQRLIIAIDGKGAFRRFKDVLLNYPAERERWFGFRAELLHWVIQQWLEREELQPKEPAPWAPPKPPVADNVQLERPVPAEGPGETLRRQAREIIDQLAAIELPAAIAFLEFLRERGAADLGRVRSIGVKRTAA